MQQVVNSFILSGQGYLVDLDMTVNPVQAQITFFPEWTDSDKSNDRPDQVILECTVQTDLAQRLQRLNRRRPIDQGVKVRFNAIYRQLAASFWGQHSEDPRHILMLKGELMKIKHWRQDNAALQFRTAC